VLGGKDAVEKEPGRAAFRDGDLLTVAEAVRISRYSRSKIYQMMAQRELSYVQHGRSRRVLRESLERLLLAGVVPASR
jgi:excisionase family DNA binding protein